VEEAEATGKPTKVVVFGRGDDSLRRMERLDSLVWHPDDLRKTSAVTCVCFSGS
jgi:hypothetical protein